MQTPTQMFRASDGRMRLDSGNMSVITDPGSRRTMILDHLKKEVRIGPMDPPAPQLPIPGIPQLPTPPAAPVNPLKVDDLGKSMIDGLEVQGKRYVLPPVNPPGLPGRPQLPQAQMPQNTISEVWTSTKLHLPVLSKTTGSFGEQITKCKCSAIGEPSPTMFQIPPDYKVIQPMDKPEMPQLAGLPKAPDAPKVGDLPKAPDLPQVPTKKIPGLG